MIHAAENDHLPVVKYLLEKGADMEAMNGVSDVTSLICNHTYITYKYIYMWMCQFGYTSLMEAVTNGRLPVVKYLVEKGADMKAKNKVSDVISLI